MFNGTTHYFRLGHGFNSHVTKYQRVKVIRSFRVISMDFPCTLSKALDQLNSIGCRLLSADEEPGLRFSMLFF